MRKMSFTEKQKNKKKKGFTLVELIIVIAVIAILAAMAIPKFSSIRTEAKVNNDVAAAKNIQIIAATLVANGTLKAGATTDSTQDDIKTKLDGKIATDGLSEATGVKFDVTIGKDESIKVKCGVNELYPDNDGTGRKAYLKAATGSND